MMRSSIFLAIGALLLNPAQSITLDVTSEDSIKSAASSIANGMVSYYHGNESGHTPGLVDLPLFWWTGGTFFNSLLTYWHSTGDSQYNDITRQGLLFQQGASSNYMPTNQSVSEGNDDQSTWALAAMTALEYGFPDGSVSSTKPSLWLNLSQNVFESEILRWDTQNCDGGLRWMIYTFSNGYNYKNTLSNGQLFQLSARLAHYTQNTTFYGGWAERIYNWTTSVNFIDSAGNVYDGSDILDNCTAINHIQFSTSAGTYLAGAAYMYNVTSGSPLWKSAIDTLLVRSIQTFFSSDILTEPSCESIQTCSQDMITYKGIFAGNLATVARLAPYTSSTIIPKLQASAKQAALHCGGGNNCSFVWNNATSSSSNSSLVLQMSSLNVVQALLLNNSGKSATSAGSGTAANTTSGSSTSGAGAASGTASGSASATPTKNAAGSQTIAGGMIWISAILGGGAFLLC